MRRRRDALVPREGAIETLDELERRGFKRGVISVCSSDVAEAWDGTEFAAHVDDVVLSCSVGLSKRDPRIYELACERLGVEADECVFVGDGANDELPGAERLGMTPLQLRPPGEELTESGQAWTGPAIERLNDVLDRV